MGNGINNNVFGALQKVVEELTSPASFMEVSHRHHHHVALPSVEAVGDIVEKLRAVIFPGYFGKSELNPDNMAYYVGSSLDEIYRLFSEQIKRGFCFECDASDQLQCENCEEKARRICSEFLEKLPEIRRLLATDMQAAYEGDPAAKIPGETVFCYPSIKVMTNHRIAHELYKLKVPLIPRIISEMAHSTTGIDIHPGASIGEKFFMDHGTGIVIGETSIIGKNVRVYQGVTLGAKSFPMDEGGNPIKGIIRHPIVEDNVIIYSGATVLGRITIGKDSVVGGNVFITRDVAPGNKVMQSSSAIAEMDNMGGAGI